MTLKLLEKNIYQLFKLSHLIKQFYIEQHCKKFPACIAARKFFNLIIIKMLSLF